MFVVHTELIGKIIRFLAIELEFFIILIKITKLVYQLLFHYILKISAFKNFFSIASSLELKLFSKEIILYSNISQYRMVVPFNSADVILFLKS